VAFRGLRTTVRFHVISFGRRVPLFDDVISLNFSLEILSVDLTLCGLT